jgi:hypothetical protein
MGQPCGGRYWVRTSDLFRVSTADRARSQVPSCPHGSPPVARDRQGSTWLAPRSAPKGRRLAVSRDPRWAAPRVPGVSARGRRSGRVIANFARILGQAATWSLVFQRMTAGTGAAWCRCVEASATSRGDRTSWVGVQNHCRHVDVGMDLAQPASADAAAMVWKPAGRQAPDDTGRSLLDAVGRCRTRKLRSWHTGVGAVDRCIPR